MKRIYTIICILLLSTISHAVELTDQTTWHRLNRYKEGCVIAGEYLFCNAYTAIEVYIIQPDGSLLLDQTYEQYGLITNLQYVEEEQKLYVHMHHYILGYSDWMNVFTVEGNELTLAETIESLQKSHYNGKFIFPLDTYTVLGNFLWPCYNKQTHQYETVTYPYGMVLGGFDDVLVTQSFADSTVRFFEVSDIHNPVLLYEFDKMELILSWGDVTPYNDNVYMVTTWLDVVFFDVSDLQNIHEIQRLSFPYTGTSYAIRPPVILSDNRCLFSFIDGDYRLYDLSDITNPQQLYYWTHPSTNTCGTLACFANHWVYQTIPDDAIIQYDINQLPLFSPVYTGEKTGITCGVMHNGFLYQVLDSILYKWDVQTGVQSEICAVPLSGAMKMVIDEPLLIMSSYPIDSIDYTVVNLTTNAIVSQFSFEDQSLLTVQDSVLFLGSIMDMNIYQINEDYSLDLLETIPSNYGANALPFDDHRIWITCYQNNFLYNTQNRQIEAEYGILFMSSPYCRNTPLKYDDRLVVCNSLAAHDTEIRLYDISDVQNPLLLDTKTLDYQSLVQYYNLGDELLECRMLTGETAVYQSFENGFTEPCDSLNFNMIINQLYIDETINLFGVNSNYYFKTFDFLPTAADPQLAPLPAVSLSNYPNPFKPAVAGRGPATTIYFETTNTHESAQIEIFNVRGQKVRELQADMSSRPQRTCAAPFRSKEGMESRDLSYSITWDGTDSANQPVASGVYLYQLRAGKQTLAQKKMMLLK